MAPFRDVPFFRVRLNADQHDVLAELERRVGADAVVRYAAPLFHRIEDLWVRQSTRAVFAGSAFIAPSAAGHPPSCWTYDDNGTPIFCAIRDVLGENDPPPATVLEITLGPRLRALLRGELPPDLAEGSEPGSEIPDFPPEGWGELPREQPPG